MLIKEYIEWSNTCLAHDIDMMMTATAVPLANASVGGAGGGSDGVNGSNHFYCYYLAIIKDQKLSFDVSDATLDKYNNEHNMVPIVTL